MASPMNYRSSNADGRYVHFGGALVAGVEYGNGVELNPSSTGAAPVITPAGDDSAINLIVKGKGTGGVFLGSTAAGTAAIKGAFAANSTISFGAVAASRAAEVTLASTTVDVMTGDIVSIGWVHATANFSSQCVMSGYRLSTVDTSRVTVIFENTTSTATSTGSGTLQFSWIDLT